jgi:hypothetical protein
MDYAAFGDHAPGILLTGFGSFDITYIGFSTLPTLRLLCI